ncbi:hypothetical protein BU26DRAFT_146114 [Trematosphaeria pertusa]|uniref:Uncharacterized protein n=1 Tax=Trematosphaeria pertusa TaxID=390896 RepID=A0A6A6IWT6_9PLEO|nr:uncharacterized protein BU26DRAFT_146114 [Trematosphaeria pertusa]KAF2254826.1 hypothetical protein BU26DRAFT_146114 [Trematosphaeria pertusa]
MLANTRMDSQQCWCADEASSPSAPVPHTATVPSQTCPQPSPTQLEPKKSTAQTGGHIRANTPGATSTRPPTYIFHLATRHLVMLADLTEPAPLRLLNRTAPSAN